MDFLIKTGEANLQAHNRAGIPRSTNKYKTGFYCPLYLHGLLHRRRDGHPLSFFEKGLRGYVLHWYVWQHTLCPAGHHNPDPTEKICSLRSLDACLLQDLFRRTSLLRCCFLEHRIYLPMFGKRKNSHSNNARNWNTYYVRH